MRRRVYPARPAPRASGGSVVGLDLSLTNTGMAAAPLGWGQDLRLVRVARAGRKLPEDATPRERIERQVELADAVLDFCKLVGARAVYVENYAFGRSDARANETVEATGIVKSYVFDNWGIVVVPAVAASARKTLLQKLPGTRGQKKGFLKAWVQRNVRRLGGPAAEWTEDQVDAFVILNHGIMLSGGVALTFPGE